MDISKIEEAAKAVNLPRIVTSGHSRLSFNIVNSEKNGRRIKLSRDLASELGLDENASILPVDQMDLVIVAKSLSFPAATTIRLKDDKGGRIAYDSAMVQMLTQLFNLPFGKRVSLSFTNIDIDHLSDGTTVALIHMNSGTKPATEAEK